MIFPAWGFFQKPPWVPPCDDHHHHLGAVALVCGDQSLVTQPLRATSHAPPCRTSWYFGYWRCWPWVLVLKRDRFKAEQFVSQEVGAVSGQIRILRQEHEDLILRHGDSIEDLKRQN